jgi:hypothetical protein
MLCTIEQEGQSQVVSKDRAVSLHSDACVAEVRRTRQVEGLCLQQQLNKAVPEWHLTIY